MNTETLDEMPDKLRKGENLMTPPLVPLRIPSGWTVNYNEFREVKADEFINDDNENRWEFSEAIFQFNHINNRILDLGWYPEHSCKGNYRLKLIESSEMPEIQIEAWNKPILNFETRCTEILMKKIEEILIEVSNGSI
ncbi:MAG TPA: hypothetical protein VGI33_02210 [Paenibacillus sp.]